MLTAIRCARASAIRGGSGSGGLAARRERPWQVRVGTRTHPGRTRDHDGARLPPATPGRTRGPHVADPCLRRPARARALRGDRKKPRPRSGAAKKAAGSGDCTKPEPRPPPCPRVRGENADHRGAAPLTTGDQGRAGTERSRRRALGGRAGWAGISGEQRGASKAEQNEDAARTGSHHADCTRRGRSL